MKRIFLKVALSVVGVLMTSFGIYAETKVIAHRGFWKTVGSAQNSLSSYIKADSIGAYGSEMDVWMTADGGLVVNHDRVFKGVEIAKASEAVARAIKLDNGENLPSLDEYLEVVKNKPSVRLVLELKELKDNEEGEREACAKVWDAVKRYGLEGNMDFISFSVNECDEWHRIAPDVPVYYLGGDLTPEEAKSRGYAGIDYSSAIFKKHPEWIEEAHRLGLKVNVWTVNNPDDMNYFIDRKVDFITTDHPADLLRILNR